KGDIKEVPTGYAQNYLLKNNLAKEANKSSISELSGQKKAQDKKAAEVLTEANELADFLAKETTVVEIKAKGGEDGRLFGSIPSKQIAEGLKKQFDLKLDKRKIELENPIRTLGYTKVLVKLHPEVEGIIKVHVVEE
ncbi:MAG: 50S ribosomal protein L9, partial [Enterococcus viikkiensis]